MRDECARSLRNVFAEHCDAAPGLPASFRSVVDEEAAPNSFHHAWFPSLAECALPENCFALFVDDEVAGAADGERSLKQSASFFAQSIQKG
ncbi:MAG: hypothetical protein M3Y69_10170 [Verrucomicrobiota bacterium]|nr:hypothetical protein [Verrucomicrobiota bacterium]